VDLRSGILRAIFRVREAYVNGLFGESFPAKVIVFRFKHCLLRSSASG